MWCIYGIFACMDLHAAQTFIDGIRNDVKEVIAMIELTTAGYFTLIGLSILAGYTIHGIVDAIKKGEFFD